MISERNSKCYDLGIILLILSFNNYKVLKFLSVTQILTILCGLNGSEFLVVGRAQYLLLFCVLKIYYGQGGPGSSHLASLVSNLCNTCRLLGLEERISEGQGTSALRGSHEMLRNIWYWCLFYDLNVSFNIGKPLYIETSKLDEAAPNGADEDSINMLKGFLHIGRKIMKALYNRNEDPNLQQLIRELTNFLELTFDPITTYTNFEMLSESKLYDILILSPLLSMVVNIYNISRVIDVQVDMQTKNGFIKFVMISSSVTVATLLRCYHLDKRENPSVLLGPSSYLPFYLNLSILLFNYLPIRALMELYGLFFYKITLFEDGLLLSTDASLFNLDLGDLNVPLDTLFSFKGVFDKFCSIFDTLRDPSYQELGSILKRSKTLNFMLALEKFNRGLIKLGLEKREQIEKNHGSSELSLNDELANTLTYETNCVYTQTIQELINMNGVDLLPMFNLDE